MKLLAAALLTLAAGARAEGPPVWGGSLEAFPRFERRSAAVPEPRPVPLWSVLRLVAREPGDQAHVDRIAAAMLRSPLARELAAELASYGRGAVVLFDERLDGRAGDDGALDGTLGSFNGERGLLVRLTPLYREPARESAAAGTLAHELLGHGLRHLRMGPDAGRLGLKRHAADETLARLIGATVMMELGDFDRAPSVRALAAGRARVEERRSLDATSYRFDLTSEQMRDALGAYRGRLAALRAELAVAEKTLGSLDFYAAAAEHFVSAHGEPPSVFTSALAQLGALRETTRADAERYARSVYLLEGVVQLAEAGRLDPAPAQLARDAEHPIIADTERRVERLLPRALALAGPAPSAPARPAGPNEIDQVIGERIKSDLDVHHEFWRETAQRLGLRR